MFSLSTILLCVSIPLAVGLGAAWLFRKDTEIENRRKNAITASQILSKAGFQRLPRIFTCFAVGDWSGIAHEVKQFAELAQNPAALALELDGVVSSLLEAKLATKEGITFVEAMVTKAKSKSM